MQSSFERSETSPGVSPIFSREPSVDSTSSLRLGVGGRVCFAHQVVLQLGHRLPEDAVVVLLEAHQLREAGDEKP